MGSCVRVAIYSYGDVISVKVDRNGELSWAETTLAAAQADPKVFTFWVLRQLKPAFFALPVDEIKIQVTPQVQQDFGETVTLCGYALGNTNRALSDLAEPLPSGAERVLFVNVDGNARNLGLYEEMRERRGDRLLYLNMSTGFDPAKRAWTESGLPLTLEELLARLRGERIGSIVSFNHYFLEKFFHEAGIYLPALLRRLGVEYVMIDHDAYDLPFWGYLEKSFYHCDGFRRFSTCSFLQEYWDRKFGNANVGYVVVPQNYGPAEDLHEIDGDYDCLVLSNSRAAKVAARLPQVLFLLERIGEKRLFYDVQLWYYAARHVLLEVMHLDPVRLSRYNGILLDVFYTAMQFLKYEAVEAVRHDREVHVYGDVGWGAVFPEAYRNRYLGSEEKDALFAERRHLFLLMNDAVSYLDASGPVFDAILRNVPFVNFPAVVKTPLLEGLAASEYESAARLKALAADIRPAIGSAAYRASLAAYRGMLRENTGDLAQALADGEGGPGEESLFERERREHNRLATELILRHVDANEGFLRDTIQVFCQHGKLGLDPSRSRYRDREYLRRLVAGARAGSLPG